ncbi:hypothetical protein LCGC14_3013210 [marine sediment metagenome]|uniref:Phage recombination protein Bet n=1 Tax=marine sediment metagenome TaxID=412755 RepID=A0A0F8XKE7_9ZZZZ
MSDIVPIGLDLKEFEWNKEQIKLLKNTVARGQDLTDDEFLLLGYVSKQAGLDPFLKQIYPVKFFSTPAKAKILTFLTSIEGYRLIAERTKRYAGRDEYMFNEGISLYHMIEDKKMTPHTATATVYKIMNKERYPTCHSVRWEEFYPSDDNKQWMWKKMGFNQLGKCAEAGALRAAFPNNYKGIYVDVEFDQSDADPAYQPEDTEDLRNETVELYGILGYNLAKVIQTNMKHIGKSDLYSAHKEQLEMLIYFLKGEVAKANEKT